MSRWDDLAFSLDQVFKGKTNSDLTSFVVDLSNQCKTYSLKKYNQKETSFELILCNSEEYQTILKSWESGKDKKSNLLMIEEFSASFFSIVYRGLAIDLERLLHLVVDPGIYNFLVNLALAIFDGVMHIRKPWLSQFDANILADCATVDFLELPLDENFMVMYDFTVERAKNILKLEDVLRKRKTGSSDA
jgi:hypothetical protein